MVISLTKKGASLQEEVPPRLFAHFDKILRQFDAREVDVAMAFLKKMRAILGD
jgi:hypothetical protein